MSKRERESMNIPHQSSWTETNLRKDATERVVRTVLQRKDLHESRRMRNALNEENE